MLEFEVDDLQADKDFVVFAGAAHELNRILSAARPLSQSEIATIRVHIALVSGTHARFETLRPIYNKEHTLCLCVYDEDIITFELQSGSVGDDIERVFELTVYLRQIVCADGLSLRKLITRGKSREYQTSRSEYEYVMQEGR
ncbi:hypothetical protein BC936DRAFT_140368 [Jimgerdemannia flammicorona]|uniref:Uncharacterized protein n=1 Tax=Jimgerdemannia flammicorona TaxID=994334 RepID=A0A433AUF4_9FUNG|nr:hypothetical protein BC936DRAFT_140368 [Jimgerdemannia flammicorona]